MGKPHARLLSGKRIIIHIFFFLLHSSVDYYSTSTWTDTSTDTQRLTDSESHTELDRESHRVRLSQPLTDTLRESKR